MAVVSVSLTSACSKSAPSGPRRVAIAPSNVLSAMPDAQQQTLTVPLVLQQDLATSNQYLATYVSDSSAAYGIQAESILRTVLEDSGDRLRVQATLTSLRTQQNENVWVAEEPRRVGLIPLLDRLAKLVDPQRASPFSTRSGEALATFTSAVASSNPSDRQQLLLSATQRDPAFGLAQIALVENARPGALPDASSPPVAQFVPLDRARWNALTARLRHASLADQASADETILQLAPNNVEALARLGSQRFLQGNAKEGERLLQKAASLNPANANLRLQLAAGLVASREFSKAESILSPLANENPNLLPSLASIYLLEGNSKEGNTVFGRFASFLPLAGQTTARVRWAALNNSGNSKSVPGVDAPAGITLFLDGKYPEAASFWRTAVNESGDTNLPARAMLAASLERSGRATEAQQIRVLPFIPDFNDPVGPVAFSEMRRLLKMK